MSIALVGVISVNGIDYSVIDQDISIQEYAAGDLVRWTRDGVTVATTPTFRVSEADVRDDGSLALIRGYLKKPTDTAYQTHLKPVCPIIYPTRMGMPDATGRRVDAWGKPFLKLRPASVDGQCGPDHNVTVGRGARYVFVDGAAGSDTDYDGSSPWPGYQCIVDSVTGQISQGPASTTRIKAGPFATMTKGITRVNAFGSGNEGPDAKLAGDWCVVLNSAVYTDGFGQIRGKGGYSPAYPTVLTSADANDPADMSKWGVVRTELSTRICIGTEGPVTGAAVRNFVIMGFTADATEAPVGSSYHLTPDHLLIYNCTFIQSTQVWIDDSSYTTKGYTWWVHCGFGPTYEYQEKLDGDGHTQCLYIGTEHPYRRTSELGVYSCYFYHGGWKDDRDEIPGYGAGTKSHSTYFSQHGAPVDSYNCMYSDSSYASGMHRPGGRIIGNVCIRNPAQFLPGCSGGDNFDNSYQDWPVQFHNNLLISAVNLNIDRVRCFGVVINGAAEGSKVRGNLIYTGDTVAQEETAEITVASVYDKPCSVGVSFNTQIMRSAASPVRRAFAGNGWNQNVTLGLTHRTDDMNIYNGVAVMNASNQMTTLAPSGTSVDSRTVSWPTPPNEDVLAQAMGFTDYADMAVTAVSNPLRRWAEEHIGNALAGCVPPATDSRLVSGLKVLGAVTPAGYWNDGSNIDANGYPTGMFYDADAQHLFDRMAGDPDAARRTAINTLIVALKDAGVWALLDAFYMAQGIDGDQLLNWKSTSYTLTPTNSPTYVTDRYFAGNGTSSYFETHFPPSTAGGNYTQNSAHAGLVLKTYVAGEYYFGTSGGGITIAAPATRVSARINSAAFLNAGTAAVVPGHYVGNRSGASDVQIYQDGASSASTTSNASTALTATTPRIGAGGSSAYSTAHIAAVHFGGSLTAQQNADLASAVSAFLVAIGNV